MTRRTDSEVAAYREGFEAGRMAGREDVLRAVCTQAFAMEAYGALIYAKHRGANVRHLTPEEVAVRMREIACRRLAELEVKS